jgi:hypothetical protein
MTDQGVATQVGERNTSLSLCRLKARYKLTLIGRRHSKSVQEEYLDALLLQLVEIAPLETVFYGYASPIIVCGLA